MINNLKDLKSGKFKDDEVEDRYGKFLAEFSLLDIREKVILLKVLYDIIMKDK